MRQSSSSHAPKETQTKRQDDQLSSALLRLVKGGPEQQAIEAGEIDAVIDYSDSNVILFPAAREPLRPAAARQATVCSTFHLIEERLASRLLMTSARVRSDQFLVTQESLAGVLGVRRESITQAAGGLQKRRLISYHRGNLRILNRQGLEAASCNCYGVLDSLNRHI